MYSIGEIAQQTGITTFTLRYYEKIGVLPKAAREGGKRTYTEEDLRFVRFIHGLKQTGMKLEDIVTFTADGCLLHRDPRDPDIIEMVKKRIQLLDKHAEEVEQQIHQRQAVRAIAEEKREYYLELIEGLERNKDCK